MRKAAYCPYLDFLCVFYIICAVNMHGERMLLHVFSLLSIGTLRKVQVYLKTCTQLAESARPGTRFHYHVVYCIVYTPFCY